MIFQYVLRRLLHLVPTLLLVSALSMFIIDLAPGDFLTGLRANPQYSQERVDQMQREFALDRHWTIQYLHWLKRVLLHGDFGQSFNFRVPVADLIGERLGNTFLLALVASLLAWGTAVPLGILSAVRQHGWVDRFSSFIAFTGLSIPQVLLALLVLYACVVTGWFPAGGMKSGATFDQLSPAGKVWDVTWHLIPPALVMGVLGMAGLTRQMRSNLLDYLRADFVRTARAKGLNERVVILKHAVRNALNPMITLFGFTLASLLSTSLIVEWIFAWPGLGQLSLDAIRRQDLYVVMATLVMSSVMLVLGNLAADVLLALSDPRISYGGRDA